MAAKLLVLTAEVTAECAQLAGSGPVCVFNLKNLGDEEHFSAVRCSQQSGMPEGPLLQSQLYILQSVRMKQEQNDAHGSDEKSVVSELVCLLLRKFLMFIRWCEIRCCVIEGPQSKQQKC